MNPNELREQIKALALDASTKSVELAFALAPVKAEGMYRHWPNAAKDGRKFQSFKEWAETDFKDVMSRSYMDQLANVGTTWWPEREKMKRLAKQGKLGIRRLSKMHYCVTQGLDRDVALKHMEHDEPIPDEFKDKGRHSDSEAFVRFTDVAFCRKGDLAAVRLGLVLAAVRGGHESLNEAFLDWTLGESVNQVLPDPKSKWEPFYPAMLADEFYCKVCGKIPTDPHLHHVIPRSLGGTDGETVTLCSPCHNKVHESGEWRKWAEEWYGKPRVQQLWEEAQATGTT